MEDLEVEFSYPLTYYSTWLWTRRYEGTGRPASIASSIILRLSKRLCSSVAPSASLRAHNEAHDITNFALRKAERLVYCAKTLGVDTALRSTLSTKNEDDSIKPSLHTVWAAKLWQRMHRIGDRALDRRDVLLCMASKCGHEKIEQFLLDGGADVDAPSERGTALRRASGCGHITIVQMLLDRSSGSFHGEDLILALEAAAAWNHKDIVLMLMSRGDKVNGFKPGTALPLAAA